MNARNAWQVIAVLFGVLALIVITPRTVAQEGTRAFQTDVPCNEPALPDTFLSRDEFVMMRVSVTDGDHKPLAGLTREDFIVREDGQPQPICFFSDDDLPVTVGLIVDASGSMAGKQAHVAAAGLAFAHASRIEDEFFAIEFNDTVRDLMSPDSPFTRQPGILNDALLQMRVGGGTALYDAVAHGLDHAARGRRDHRALILISAGRDTASRLTLAQLVDRVAVSPTVVYAIGILDPGDPDADPEPLKRLASLSGGEAFFLKRPSELRSILERIARDIRTSYTIGYTPARSGDGARFHSVEIGLTEAYCGARLRYREGYALESMGHDLP